MRDDIPKYTLAVVALIAFIGIALHVHAHHRRIEEAVPDEPVHERPMRFDDHDKGVSCWIVPGAIDCIPTDSTRAGR